MLDVPVEEGMKKLTYLMIVVSVISAFLPVFWENRVFPTVRIAPHRADVIFKAERRNGAKNYIRKCSQTSIPRSHPPAENAGILGVPVKKKNPGG